MDFSAFRKIDLPASVLAGFRSASDILTAIVQLREGARAPDYVEPTTWIGGALFTTRINADQWQRLETDPAVASVSLGETLRRID